MKYSELIRRGEPEWLALEDQLIRARREGLKGLSLDEVERLAALQRRVTSDFAYARTHFAGTEVVARLRQLAFDGHRLLAARPAPAHRRVWRFFTRGYPEVFQAARRHLTVALSCFLVAAALGFVIAAMEPGFLELYAGPGTVDSLRRGEIWTDYVGMAAPAQLSSSIFTNNITVGLITWVGGATLGLLTLFELLFNGMMVGAMISVCWRYELLERLFAFISAHGPLELFLIVVSGAAGLMLAEGAVVPRNRPRAESFAAAGRQSVLLFAGTVPWFVMLGIVEGYISPVMSLPTPLKVGLGVILLGVFLIYALAPRAGAGSTG